MTLSDREKLIFYMVTISHSSYGKMATMQTKGQILKFLRDTTCPSVSNQEWQEISNDIKSFESTTMKSLMDGFLTSMGGKLGLGDLLKGKVDETTLQKIADAEEKSLVKLSDSKIDMNKIKELDANIDDQTKKQALELFKKKLEERG